MVNPRRPPRRLDVGTSPAYLYPPVQGRLAYRIRRTFVFYHETMSLSRISQIKTKKIALVFSVCYQSNPRTLIGFSWGSHSPQKSVLAITSARYSLSRATYKSVIKGMV